MNFLITYDRDRGFFFDVTDTIAPDEPTKVERLRQLELTAAAFAMAATAHVVQRFLGWGIDYAPRMLANTKVEEPEPGTHCCWLRLPFRFKMPRSYEQEKAQELFAAMDQWSRVYFKAPTKGVLARIDPKRLPVKVKR